MIRLRGLGSTADEEVALDGCSVFVYRPKGESDPPRPALLWIHGGGLIMGDARQDEPIVRRIVDELGIIVASVQYRLAPEYPFPVPLEDCEQAFEWLARQPEVDADRLMVGGVSAGGGLAAALCQRARHRPGPRPGFQLLIYPMLDDRSSEGEGPNDRLFRMWDRRSNVLGWDSYLRGHDPGAPPEHAVPARTEDLSDLPPAWIGVGTVDLFLDEDVDYARRLQDAQVTTRLEIVEGAYHGFDFAAEKAPVARRFRDAQVAALAEHLERSKVGSEEPDGLE